MPAVVVLGFVLSLLDEQARWVQGALVLALGVGWLWLSNRLEQRLSAASCPRCGQPFFARQWGPFELHGVFFGACRGCGLGLRADKRSDTHV